jgi:hypothetical protein
VSVRLSRGMDIFQISRVNDFKACQALFQSDGDAETITALSNDRDDRGRTPLHICASFGSDETMTLLLRYGADHTLQDWVDCI